MQTFEIGTIVSDTHQGKTYKVISYAQFVNQIDRDRFAYPEVYYSGKTFIKNLMSGEVVVMLNCFLKVTK